MSLVVGEHVSKSYGDANVLVNASFTLAAGESVGLVGPNGEGKTTLLKIVGGMLEPTEGVVQRRRDLRIGYLPQDPPRLE
ncbi:MAG: ATP-binding cassette domain-containing protein, partial [Phycisphaerae bacterium]